jgi:hypothetical protein
MRRFPQASRAEKSRAFGGRGQFDREEEAKVPQAAATSACSTLAWNG